VLVANGVFTWFDEASGFAGDTAELRCAECGYGIVVRREPPACPMYRASAWLLPSGDPCIWK
jgi:hypothetical protein